MAGKIRESMSWLMGESAVPPWAERRREDIQLPQESKRDPRLGSGKSKLQQIREGYEGLRKLAGRESGKKK